MKPLVLATVAAGLVLAVGAIWSGELAEARVQLENEGLAIDGIVRVRGTRETVSGAEVSLSAVQDLVQEAGRLVTVSVSRVSSVMSGPDGSFRFVGLEPGQYALAARRRDPAVGRSWHSSRTIALGDGRLPSGVTLWIPSEPVEVAGRVIDGEDRPVQGASVSTAVPSWRNGVPVLQTAPPSFSTRTDTDGSYRLPVYPGTYYLIVSPPPDAASTVSEYYPGVLFPEDAVPVTVPAGAGLQGIDVVLPRRDLYRVRFHMPLPEYVPGLPDPLLSYAEEDVPPFVVQARLQGRGLYAERILDLTTEALGDDVYQTSGLPSGEYDLRIALNRRFTAKLGSPLWPQRESVIEALDPMILVAVSLDDRDIDLGTPQAEKVSTTVHLTRPNPRSGGPGLENLHMFWFQETRTPAVGRVPMSFIGPGGSSSPIVFHPGLFRFNASEELLPDGWYVASVRSGGRDVLADGLEVGGPISPIEIVIASDGGRVDGVVRNADATLIPDAFVVFIPPAARRGPLLRFPSATADTGGRFSLSRVPPGDYRVLALDTPGLEEPIWESPEFLRQYELQGERITVDPNSNMTLNLEAIPFAP